jgi:hypothetical protein
MVSQAQVPKTIFSGCLMKEHETAKDCCLRQNLLKITMSDKSLNSFILENFGRRQNEGRKGFNAFYPEGSLLAG